MLLKASAPANKLFCDVTGCHVLIIGVCVGNRWHVQYARVVHDRKKHLEDNLLANLRKTQCGE